MECQCDKDGDVVPGWWLGGNNFQMGGFAVVGYLLYRFSQTLPALIRWPIRLFCSLTGLSALWGWVSHLVRTLRGIKRLFKFLSGIWRFIVGSSTDGDMGNPSSKPGLRLILIGPAGGGRTTLLNTLSGNSDTNAPKGHLLNCTKQMTVLDGREVTLIDTPDILGPSLGINSRAREALRSLQLVSPGPHAFLLVVQAPGSSMGIGHDANQAMQAMLELFGEGVVGHIIPVLTHADRLGGRRTVDQLLEVDTGALRRAVSLCGQKPELVDNRPDCPPEEQSATRRQLVGRVMELKELRGHFVHELQRREDRIREELLTDMASALARKLGHM
ncbi:GTPase IMAP family member 1-like [Hippoglossus hippoglossus]|uniref:GTPase IMAP family member 1-like n=1 Tax=Hippoglossus hippoglossus TaxID=8267 RepID=UPI00148D42C4|nr:GTPase IMAP family member 1-like [Hippoglossus hippoglossus]XP_035000761.1 GTPase IMAP family member 1 [Hippoglossus stenolepis]